MSYTVADLDLRESGSGPGACEKKSMESAVPDASDTAGQTETAKSGSDPGACGGSGPSLTQKNKTRSNGA